MGAKDDNFLQLKSVRAVFKQGGKKEKGKKDEEASEADQCSQVAAGALKE